MITNLYQTDFHKWATEQATLLRSGNLAALDIDNLIDEVENMAKSERRELESRLIVLIAHLLKWAYQPDHRSNSWRATIKWQRLEVFDVLKINPGLKPSLSQIFYAAYPKAKLLAIKDTNLDENCFPNTCTWTLPQILDDGFWPDQLSSRFEN